MKGEKTTTGNASVIIAWFKGFYLKAVQETYNFFSSAGTGAWDRNAEEMEFMFMDSFKSATGGEEKFEMLGLYAKKMTYSITT